MRSVHAQKSRTALTIAVLSGFLTIAGLVVDVFADDLGLASGWQAAGRVATYLGIGTCVTALWVAHRYPVWISDRTRPAGLPVLNDESRKQPLWLLVASMLIPYAAFATLLLAVGIVYVLVRDTAPSPPLDAAKLVVALLGIAATAVYVIAVATKRQRANEAKLGDLLASASVFASLGLTSAVLLPIALGDDRAITRGPLAWACAISLAITAVVALAISGHYRPIDKWGRPEETRWSYRRRKHA